MKKIITLSITALFVLVLTCSLVFAQGNAQDTASNETEDSQETTAKDSPPQGTESPKGLSLALTNVKNENAQAKLQENIEKFQEKYKARLERMQDVEVEKVDEETGEVTIKAKEPVKYLGFIKGTATKRFNINAEGAIEEHAPWYSFLYAEDTTASE